MTDRPEKKRKFDIRKAPLTEPATSATDIEVLSVDSTIGNLRKVESSPRLEALGALQHAVGRVEMKYQNLQTGQVFEGNGSGFLHFDSQTQRLVVITAQHCVNPNSDQPKKVYRVTERKFIIQGQEIPLADALYFETPGQNLMDDDVAVLPVPSQFTEQLQEKALPIFDGESDDAAAENTLFVAGFQSDNPSLQVLQIEGDQSPFIQKDLRGFSGGPAVAITEDNQLVVVTLMTRVRNPRGNRNLSQITTMHTRTLNNNLLDLLNEVAKRPQK